MRPAEMAVHHCTTNLGRFGFLHRYPGGITLRLHRRASSASLVLILRTKSYVPDFVEGWRKRIGKAELHVRRVK